jgi:hypothetical protein
MYRYGGMKLSGINDLKGKHAGGTAVMCCSGVTFKDYDDKKIPKDWIRFSINETIRKLGGDTRYWVISDDPILSEYHDYCPANVNVLAMRQATRIAGKVLPKNRVWTVDSMADPADYDNGYQFYSRGTVLIGAIEMARWMGINRFFCFGLDCYCGSMDSDYYYDGRRPQHASEHQRLHKEQVKDSPPDLRIWVTHRLRKMIEKLNAVRAAGLWDGIEIHCVGSPSSQQNAIEKISDKDFDKLVSSETTKKSKSRIKRTRSRKVSEGESSPEPKEVPIDEPRDSVEDQSELPLGHDPITPYNPGEDREHIEEGDDPIWKR